MRLAKRPGLLLAMLSTAAGAVAPVDAGPANVLLIVVDDLGWRDLGCTGSLFHETPNIDRLASEGVMFTQAYAAAAVCSPSRAAILTGRAPARLGITDWIRPFAGRPWNEREVRSASPYVTHEGRLLETPRNPRWMQREEITVAEVLHVQGYATGFVGKWHLGPASFGPEDQGFEFNAGGCDLGHPPSYFDPYQPTHQPTTFPNLPPRREGEYLTDREVDEVLRFLRTGTKDRPFLVCWWPYAVHAPIRAKPELIERYERKPPVEGEGQRFATYAAMVHSIDEGVGRIMRALADRGVADRTLVIFTSDNGGATHFRATDNRPLRSGKGRPYEGGLRVPLIMRWPARFPAATRNATPVTGTDLLKTICAAIGTYPPFDRPLDGADLMPLATGDRATLERKRLFWHFPHYWWNGRVTPYSIIREGDRKLIRFYEEKRDELYDLAADPSETNDLAAEQPQETRRLRTALDAWLDEAGGLRPRPRTDDQHRGS